MSNFKVGDVCEVLNPRGATYENVGMIVTISQHVHTQSNGMEFYTVEELSPHWFAHDELRLMRPPNNDFIPGDWELIPWWSPYRVGEPS